MIAAEPMSIPAQLQRIAEDICDHYCKFPEQYEGDDGIDRLISEHCENCPINKLC